MAQVRAFWAFCWALVSIVSVSESPGCGSLMVCRTWEIRPEASRATLCVPYVPRSCVSYCASIPTLPMTSSGRYPASFNTRSRSPEIGPVYPRIWDKSGPSAYWRRASTATSTPGRSVVASEISRAVCSSTSVAIRTRSKFDPGLPSIAALMSDAGKRSNAASRSTTTGRKSSGRSAGRSFTTNVATLETRARPLRSKITPRGDWIGSSDVRFLVASVASRPPSTIWR